MDPWYDYLALPIAPLVIAIQCVALALRDTALKRVIAVGGAIAVASMFVVAVVAGLADGTANIGAGLLLIEAAISGCLMAGALGWMGR